jgi:EAL domain-containing protein (putative c-di-GMP-specific phosphodiesterase class I)
MSVVEDHRAHVDDERDLRQILARVREHLGMEIAYVSAFTAGQEVVVVTSGDPRPLGLVVGAGRDTDETYCMRVLSGALPSAIPDARRDPVARELPVTAELGIGAYIGAPLRGPDGQAVGMLCCLSRGANPLLDDDATRVMALAAALVEDRMGCLGLPHRPAVSERVRRVRAVLDSRDVHMVYQPIVRLDTRETVGLEALARFDPVLFPTPVHAFSAAVQAGLGVELELLAVECALSKIERLAPGGWLAVNLSAEALLDPRAAALVLPHGPAVGVEITEHTPVHDYGPLVEVTEELKARGVHVAVDDAGAGFSSLRHVLQLRPTAIKLDIELIRGIDTDPVRQTLTRSVDLFAGSMGSVLVAEGVETEQECRTLRALGVRYGQGYLFGRPAEWPAA